MGSPKPSRILGAFGLGANTSESELYEEFARFGRIEKCELINDRRTGRSRGFGFIYFEHLDDARKAKEECNGMRIDGANIRVDYSLTKRAHTPTPGQYMGRESKDAGDERSGGSRERGGAGGYDRYNGSGRSSGYDERRSPPRRSYYERDYDRGYSNRDSNRDRDRGGYEDRGYNRSY